jgi:methyltransferase (TIGR00027 family)
VKDDRPRLTARGAAGHRAAHQLLEKGRVFRDPLARAILGAEGCAEADERARDLSLRPLRLLIAARSRFAEEALAAAVAAGLRQAVVLGAGLDTFAMRNPHAQAGLRVFEVDHPATQAWKRRRLANAGLTVPPSLRFVPVDFERESLAQRLSAEGFDAGAPAFFFWLGVVPYLTRDAILATLRLIAQIPGGEVVFDYSEPLANYPAGRRRSVEALMERAAAAGEPMIAFPEPAELARELRALGFHEIEDLGLAEISKRFLGGRKGLGRRAGPHFMRTRRRV